VHAPVERREHDEETGNFWLIDGQSDTWADEIELDARASVILSKP
jgi:hypothetical protein